MERSIRILVAEPIPDIRDLYRFILDPVADHIDFAGDVQEGLVKIENDVYDLVFLDLGVPELEGLDGTEILNQLHPDLPVIVSCSINLPTRLAARLLTRPTNFFVSKPFDIKEIREIVLHACSSVASKAEVVSLPRQPHIDTLAEAV